MGLFLLWKLSNRFEPLSLSGVDPVADPSLESRDTVASFTLASAVPEAPRCGGSGAGSAADSSPLAGVAAAAFCSDGPDTGDAAASSAVVGDAFAEPGSDCSASSSLAPDGSLSHSAAGPNHQPPSPASLCAGGSYSDALGISPAPAGLLPRLALLPHHNTSPPHAVWMAHIPPVNPRILIFLLLVLVHSSPLPH